MSHICTCMQAWLPTCVMEFRTVYSVWVMQPYQTMSAVIMRITIPVTSPPKYVPTSVAVFEVDLPSSCCSGADIGLGCNSGTDIELGCNSGVEVVGLGCNSGVDIGLDCNSGVDIGLDCNSGVDIGLDCNSGVDIGLGCNSGVDIGLGCNSGVDIGLGCNSGVDIGLGCNSGVDIGLGCNSGVEVVGLGCNSGVEVVGLGCDSGVQEGLHTLTMVAVWLPTDITVLVLAACSVILISVDAVICPLSVEYTTVVVKVMVVLSSAEQVASDYPRSKEVKLLQFTW